MQVNDAVTLTGPVFAVPDHSDERIQLDAGPVLYEVMEVQDDAILIRDWLESDLTVYAITGHERGCLKLKPLSPEQLGRDRAEAAYDAEHGEGAYTRWRHAKAEEGRMLKAAQEYDAIREEVLRSVIPAPSIDANERRVILAALETYQSMWRAAVTEARKDGDSIDERLAQGRYDEAAELLAKFQREPEGASPAEMVGKLDVNIAAEQARDRLASEIAEQPRGTSTSAAMAASNAFIDSVDPDIRRRDRGGDDALGRESKSGPYSAAELERLDHNLNDLR